MTSKQYLKGRRKEYKIKWALEELGYICARSAGSHSPVDIWAIHPEKKLIKLIQSKAGDSYTDNEKKTILEANKALQGDFSVTFEVI